jgi:hypothetical protein
MRNLGPLAEGISENVGDRSFLNHERTVHVGFAELELRIE